MIMFETDQTARALLMAKAEEHPGWVQLSEEPDSAGATRSVLALKENNFALFKSIPDDNKPLSTSSSRGVLRARVFPGRARTREGLATTAPPSSGSSTLSRRRPLHT